jgi:hypothetical protein
MILWTNPCIKPLNIKRASLQDDNGDKILVNLKRNNKNKINIYPRVCLLVIIKAAEGP